jgi:hypothetical protein
MQPARGAGIIVSILMVVVVLAGVGVGFYFWGRSAASGTALRFVDAQVAFFTQGKMDFATLRAVVTKEDVADIEKLEGWMNQLPGNLSSLFGSVQATTAVKDQQVGFSDGTVTVTVTATAVGRSTSRDIQVAVVRQGLSWKVSSSKTGNVFQQFFDAGGQPQL